MRVLVSGGGTAGHIYPALTVAEQVSADGHDEVAFVGTPNGLEARLAREADLPFFPVRARGWDRAKPLTLVAAAFVTAASFVRCLYLLRRVRADVVVGFGGYVSLPLGLAAAFANVPLVLHEQNSVPGIANRTLSRWAAAVCVTYPDSIHRLAHPARAIVTGDPVRPSIAMGDERAARKALKLTRSHPVMLVFGGSRGARHLNEATIDLYSRLSDVKGLQVVQLTGPEEIDASRARLKSAAGGRVPRWWKLVGYLEEMGDALAVADLVVCRAGATTIAELTAAGKAAVLVPYPHATDDHQNHNAWPLREAGAAVVIADDALSAPAFGDEITDLLQDARRRRQMALAAAHLGRPNAAHCITETALDVAKAHSPWRLRMPRTLKPLSSWSATASPVTPAPSSESGSEQAGAGAGEAVPAAAEAPVAVAEVESPPGPAGEAVPASPEFEAIVAPEGEASDEEDSQAPVDPAAVTADTTVSAGSSV